MESKEERSAGGRRYGVVRVSVEDEARIRSIAQKLSLSVEEINDRLSVELLGSARVQRVLAQIVREECNQLLCELPHFGEGDEEPDFDHEPRPPLDDSVATASEVDAREAAEVEP